MTALTHLLDGSGSTPRCPGGGGNAGCLDDDCVYDIQARCWANEGDVGPAFRKRWSEPSRKRQHVDPMLG